MTSKLVTWYPEYDLGSYLADYSRNGHTLTASGVAMTKGTQNPPFARM